MHYQLVLPLFFLSLQVTFGQYHGHSYGAVSLSGLAATENAIANNLAYNAANAGFPNGMRPDAAFGNSLAGYNSELGQFNGGGFMVRSSSPIAPSGVTVQSENLLVEGPLAVQGQLPFLGVVAVEGPLPAAGQGAVAYGCGNGNVGMVGENIEGMPVSGFGGGNLGMMNGLNGIPPLGRNPLNNGLGVY